MDVLNEEEAMFESPLVDSHLSSPVTVSSPAQRRQREDYAGPTGGLFYIAFPFCYLWRAVSLEEIMHSVVCVSV